MQQVELAPAEVAAAVTVAFTLQVVLLVLLVLPIAEEAVEAEVDIHPLEVALVDQV